ncbi:hypothetical protein [Undibacterium sp. SXout20W]|uniref:hypothetical protein n=1 Tax=Undibacterium sp. SXout20W TaxID=3413051 RepID=UPI003BF2061F
MANNFQITISAIDRATAVVRKINASMDRLTKPITQMRQSMRALAKEAGFDKVGRSIGNVGRSAATVAGKLTSMLGPLSIIVGGGTIAGIAAVATEWARFGSEVSNSSALIDISVDSLQSLCGAASVVGVGAQELTGGLKSLGDTMEDALYGRNQQALVVLNRLGIGIHKTKDGSIDAARGFRDLSLAISGIKNTQVQGVIARTFGLEATLPLLRKGPKAIEEYERKVASLGGVMSGSALEAAQNFAMSLDYLSIATQATRNSIGEKLVPILQPLIEQFTAWTAANRDLIATKVAQFVEGLAHWINELDFKKIGDDLRAFAKDVDNLVDSLGGWKNAAIGLVFIMNGSLIGSLINLGLAIGNLGVVAIPALIRGIGLLAAGLDATLVPAILKGLLSIGLYVGGLAEMAVGIPIVGVVLEGLSAAFLGLGAAIAATPIGWIIAGIAAIGFGVYAIYKNWDAIGEYFSKKFGAVKAAFDKSWSGGILAVLEEFNPTKIVADAMNGLSKWLFDFDLFDAGKNVISGMVRGMKSILSLLPNSALRMIGMDSWVSGSSSGVQTSAQSGNVPLGVRNNNPGNLRSWGATPRDTGGYAVFPTADAGLAATIQNLQAQQKLHGLNTIRGIISRWAPSSENNTAAYISDMVKKTGFGADQPLNLNDARTVAPMISGIVKHEGNSSGFSDDMINKAVSAQLGGGAIGSQSSGPQKMEVALTLHGLPSGVSATAKTDTGTAMPVRVAYTMPTGITP